MRQLVSLMVNTKISAIKVPLRSSVDNWLVRKMLEAALTGSELKTFIHLVSRCDRAGPVLG